MTVFTEADTGNNHLRFTNVDRTITQTEANLAPDYYDNAITSEERAGKYVIAFNIDHVNFTDASNYSDMAIGIADPDNADLTFGSWFGADQFSVGLWYGEDIYREGIRDTTYQLSYNPGYYSGQRVLLAVDTTLQLIWWKIDDLDWNAGIGSLSPDVPDPALGLGGYDYGSALSPGNLVGAVVAGVTVASYSEGGGIPDDNIPIITMDATPLASEIPDGFSPWDESPVPVWPTSLPQCPLEINYVEQPHYNVVRTEMESGRARHRRRYPQVFAKLAMTWCMTGPQLAEFKRWLREDVGASFFEIDLLLDEAIETVTARFTPQDKITIEPLTPDLWRVDVVLEIKDIPDFDSALLTNIAGGVLGTIGEFALGEGEAVISSDGALNVGAWPSALPDCPLITGFKQEPQLNIIRSNVDTDSAGRQDTRRTGLAVITLTWMMSGEQVMLFKQWIEKVLFFTSFFDISLRLDFTRTVRARFIPQQSPLITYVAPDLFQVDAQLEVDDRRSTSGETVANAYNANLGTLGEQAIGEQSA
jgi:hypothetical protein